MLEYFLIGFATLIVAYYIYVRFLSVKPEVKNKCVEDVNRFMLEFDAEKLKNEYFTHDTLLNLQATYADLNKRLNSPPLSRIRQKEFDDFRDTFSNLDELVKKRNELYISGEIQKNKSLFDNIDGKSLDGQQRRVVVVDETSNLQKLIEEHKDIFSNQ